MDLLQPKRLSLFWCEPLYFPFLLPRSKSKEVLLEYYENSTMILTHFGAQVSLIPKYTNM